MNFKKLSLVVFLLVMALTVSSLAWEAWVPADTTIDNSEDCLLQIVSVEGLVYKETEPYKVTVKNISDFYVHYASFDVGWTRMGGYGKTGEFDNIIGKRFDSWPEDPIAPGETRTFVISSGSEFSTLDYIHTWLVGYSEDGGFVESMVWRDF